VDLVAEPGQQQGVIDMPTASGMPMPMTGEQGLASGFKMGDSLMQNLLNRQKLQQQQEQFAQELALKKQTEGRASQLFPLQLQQLRRQVDPKAQMDYYRQLQELYGQQSGAPDAQPVQPTQPMGEGMGMFPADAIPTSLPSSEPAEQSSMGNAVIQTPIGMMTPQQAQGMLAAGIKFPGVEKQLERYFQGATSPLGKAISDLEYLKRSGASSEQVKQMEDYVARLSEGTPGMQLNVDPATGAVSFSTGRGQRSLTQQLVDGQIVTQPTTATMTAHQKQQLASIAREKALEHIEQPYLGLGATFQMADDLKTYQTSPNQKLREDAKNRLIKSAVSEKIVPEIAALQLNSQGVPATVHALEKQEQSIRQGWPMFGKAFVDNLPSDLQEEVVKEHNKRLKELTDIRQKYFVKGMPVDVERPETTPTQQEKTVVVINPKGERFRTPESNAQNLPEGWKRG
jgi:hypothetical protein